MLKQMKKTLAILLALCFLISVTAAAVSAAEPGKSTINNDKKAMDEKEKKLKDEKEKKLKDEKEKKLKP